MDQSGKEASSLSPAAPVFVHGVGAMQFERSRTVATPAAAAAAAAAIAAATAVPTLDESNPSNILPVGGAAHAMSPLPRSPHHSAALDRQTPAALAEQPPPSHSVADIGSKELDVLTA
ncbi:unnamed protein product, partial [Sphacelaria rigidula]